MPVGQGWLAEFAADLQASREPYLFFAVFLNCLYFLNCYTFPLEWEPNGRDVCLPAWGLEFCVVSICRDSPLFRSGRSSESAGCHFRLTA